MTDDPPASGAPVPRPSRRGDVAGAGSLLLEEEFGARSLDGLRQAVREQAASAGMSEERVGDVMIAVHELASNAVRHGAGRGRLRMWSQDGALSCQVQDGGRGPRGGQADGPDGADVAAGWPYAHDHGLWLVRLLADQMSVVSSPGGTCVTVIFALG